MSVFTGLCLDCVDSLQADLGWAWLVALVQSVCLPEPGSSLQGGLCSGSWAEGTDTPHGRLGLGRTPDPRSKLNDSPIAFQVPAAVTEACVSLDKAGHGIKPKQGRGGWGDVETITGV